MFAHTRLVVDKAQWTTNKRRLNLSALRDEETASSFREAFTSDITSESPEDYATLNNLKTRIEQGFKSAANACLTPLAAIAKRPWISPATLELIEVRNSA